MAFWLKLCCCATHFPGASCIASSGWLWDLGCFPGLRQVLWAGAVLHSAHSWQRHHHTLLLRQSFNLLPSAPHSHLCNVPNILPRVNFGALDKRCPTVQSKEKTWHLTAELLAQETGCSLCRDLQDGSALSPGAGQKVSIIGLKKLRLPLFFPFYIEKIYDLLLLHSFCGPEAAFLEGISALGHSQESPPPTARRDV